MFGAILVALQVWVNSSSAQVPELKFQNQILPFLNSSVYEPVENDSIILLGKGIRNKVGDVVSLACLPSADQAEECRILRFVYYRKELNQAFYFGRYIEILDDQKLNQSQEIKKRLRAIGREFRKDYTNDQISIWFGAGTVAVGAAIGVGLGVTGVIAAGPAGTIVLVAMGAGLGIAILANCGLSIIPHGAGFSRVVIDQDGWNWSQHSKRASNRQFSQLVHYINSYVCMGCKKEKKTQVH